MIHICFKIPFDDGHHLMPAVSEASVRDQASRGCLKWSQKAHTGKT
jgi:hypothetical protein